MRRDCILVLFLPLYLNLYTNIQSNYLLQKYFSLKQKKQTTHQVSCQSLLNHCNFSAGLYVKQESSRGSLQGFSGSSLQLNRSIILPFSELMEKEPRHRLVVNCMHSTFAVCSSVFHARRNVMLRRVQSLFLSVTFFFKITYQIHLYETMLKTLFHIFWNVFVAIWFLVQ